MSFKFRGADYHKVLFIPRSVYAFWTACSIQLVATLMDVFVREAGAYARQRANYDSCSDLNHAEYHNTRAVGSGIKGSTDGGDNSQASKAVYAENCDADTPRCNLGECWEGKDAD
jgi:hypothetical protein